MREGYILFYMNKPLGRVSYDKHNDTYNFTLTAKSDYINLLPLLFRREPNGVSFTSNSIKEFIEDRVIPEDRQTIDWELKQLGLAYYDLWSLFLMSRGMSHDDYYWIGREGDKYEDLHWRYLMESGKTDKIQTVFYDLLE